MEYELELTKTNRLNLARVFQENKRVDFSMDCVIEGQMGKAFVDSRTDPTAYRITVGPFWYFAGDAYSSGGAAMMSSLPAYSFLMPSPPGWVELARQVYGQNLYPFRRYSFSSADLSAKHLEGLVNSSPYREQIIPLNVELAATLAERSASFLDLSDFDSVSDFIERGLSFAVVAHGRVMGAAFSSLVCSQGIEVSVFVEERYRRQGVATVLASKLVLESLKQNLRPNWDAANPESCKLAKKLGYTFVEEYEAYYHT